MKAQTTKFFVLYCILMTAIIMSAVYVETGAENFSLVSIPFWGGLYLVLILLGVRSSGNSEKMRKKIADRLIAFVTTIVAINLFTALLVILKWIVAALCISLPARRSLYYLLLASTTLVILSASLAKSTGFLFFILLYAILCVGILSLIHRTDITVKNPIQDVSLTSSKTIKGLTTTAITVTIPVLILASLVYFLVPRPNALNIGESLLAEGELYKDNEWEKEADAGGSDENTETAQSPQSSSQENTDQSDLVSDSLIGTSGNGYSYNGFNQSFNITESAEQGQGSGNPIVLYVRSAQPVYLKSRIFDQFDGEKWAETLHYDHKKLLDNGELVVFEQQQHLDQPLLVEVDVQTGISDEVPLTDRALRLRFPATVLSVDPRGLVRAPQDLRRGTIYSFTHQAQHYDRRPTSQPIDSMDSTPYLDLRGETDPRIAQLASDVAADSTSTYEKAEALEHFLQTNFQYSLASAFSSQNNTPLPAFLFEHRTGHCEYFASAMAVMLRTLEIPSRLVTGFSVQHYNPLTGLYEVRALHGHAWVEAYVNEVGWVSFQPTPGYLMPLQEEQNESPQTTGEELNQYLEQLSQLDQVKAPEDLSAQALTFIYKLWKSISTNIKFMAQRLKHWIIDNIWLAATIGFAGSGTFILIIIFRQKIRRHLIRLQFRRTAKMKDDKFWGASYKILGKWFGLAGFVQQPWMTIEEYVESLPLSDDILLKLRSDYVQPANRQIYGPSIDPNQQDRRSIRQQAIEALSLLFNPGNDEKSPPTEIDGHSRTRVINIGE